jgi:hypothetical protein
MHDERRTQHVRPRLPLDGLVDDHVEQNPNACANSDGSMQIQLVARRAARSEVLLAWSMTMLDGNPTRSKPAAAKVREPVTTVPQPGSWRAFGAAMIATARGPTTVRGSR